jgi:S1-C subfamily serine protease
VLKLKGDVGKLPTIEYADSDAVQVGDLALAIGDPFGVGQTVTSGIISAFARVPGNGNEDQYFIQTDAAINPGNSGGALVDINGRLIGINRMIVSSGGGSNGIGFAIPSNLVKVVASAAQSGGAPKRPWLGADLQEVTPEIAAGMALDTPSGVLVSSVDAKGPADAAGLKSGDLIIAIDGEEVDDVGALSYRLATKKLGSTAKLEIVRDKKHYTAAITLEPAPETVPRDMRKIAGDSPLAGLTVLNLSPAVADELSYSGTAKGVIVSDVADGSNADAAGFRKGDIIAKVNGVTIDTTERLQTAAGDAQQYWDLAIRRGGRLIQQQFRG